MSSLVIGEEGARFPLSCALLPRDGLEAGKKHGRGQRKHGAELPQAIESDDRVREGGGGSGGVLAKNRLTFVDHLLTSTLQKTRNLVGAAGFEPTAF